MQKPLALARGFVTPSGFKLYIDFQYFTIFVDQIVDLEQRTWAIFT